MGHLSRLPNSNDPPVPTTKWGSQSEIYDDFAALLNGDALRCVKCRCVVITKHQTKVPGGISCPDCKDKK